MVETVPGTTVAITVHAITAAVATMGAAAADNHRGKAGRFVRPLLLYKPEKLTGLPEQSPLPDGEYLPEYGVHHRWRNG